MTTEEWNSLKAAWTDQLITLKAPSGKLARFAGITGRVVTVNANGACLVDFQDGGWYDITPTQLTVLSDQQAAAALYHNKKNSAQKLPVRQA